MSSGSISWVTAIVSAVSGALSSKLFWVGCGVGVLLAAGVCVVATRRRYRASSMTVSLPFGLGSVTYETSSDDRMIAWKMYVQLKTRKAALPFDEPHDVVADVHSSLYELFPVARELLSGMHLDDIARPKGVAELILRTLNGGLRPYLTRWNACYRRWWEQQIKDNTQDDKTPQQLQQQYPQYKELVEDLKRTNTGLSKFADELLAIARADRPEPTQVQPIPAPPTVSEESGQVDIMGGHGVELPTTPYDSVTSVAQKNPVQEGSA